MSIDISDLLKKTEKMSVPVFEPEEPKNKFVSPDNIWDGGRNETAIAFYFTDDHKIFLSFPTATHGDLSRSKKYTAYHVEKRGYPPDTPHPKTALVGRVGQITFGTPKGNFVSFWNTDGRIFNALLPACLSKLKSLELIDDATYISSYLNKYPITYREYKKHGFSTPASPEDINKINADREIHLLQGNNKKQALLQRGATPKPSPWKDLTPGQKHWAMASESFKDWLRHIES